MDTCKAAVFVGTDQPLEIQEFGIPEIEIGGALLRMEMAAICGTDAHAIHHPDTPAPMIFGHENIGILTDVPIGTPADVLGEKLSPGDRVIFRDAACGQCYACAMGDRCENGLTYGMLPADTGPRLRGGFGQFIYLSPTPWILRVPDSVSTDRALLSVVGNHTALNGIERIGGIGLADTVLVQGSGPIGMGALTQARAAGAGRIIVIGAPENRLALARELGANDTISLDDYQNPESRVQKVHELTRGRGPDVVIEASGGLSAFQEGLDMVRIGGRYLVIGQWTDYGPLGINPSLLTRKSLRVTGVSSGGPRHIIRSLLAMQTVIDTPVEKLITHRYALDSINEGFAAHSRLEAMVAVILPNA